MESKYMRKHPSINENMDFRFGSSSSASGEFCRICHESDSINPLITPCMCAGSLKYVHQNCLQMWLSASETDSCELCKYSFIIQSKIKPFCEWKSLDMTGVERRRLFCAVLFNLAAALCVIWSLCVLIERSAEEVRTNRLEWPLVTKLIVVTVGLTGGIVFMYIQCKQYLSLCYRWRARNRILLIQNAPEKTKNISGGALKDEASHESSSLSLRHSNSANFIASTEVTIENNNDEVFPTQIVAKIESNASRYELKTETSQKSLEAHLINDDISKPSTSKSFIQHGGSLDNFEKSGDNKIEFSKQTSIFSENNDILNDVNYPQIKTDNNSNNFRTFDDVKSLRRFSDTKLLIVHSNNNNDNNSDNKTMMMMYGDNQQQQASASSNNRNSIQFDSNNATNNLLLQDNQNKVFKSLPNIVNV